MRFYSKDFFTRNFKGILELLCKNRNEFVCRTKIIETVWREDHSKLKEGSLNNVLSKLRKYLNKDTEITMYTKINLGVKLMLKEK